LKEKLGGVPIEGPHRADQFLLDGWPRKHAPTVWPMGATSLPTAG
jgi:hypothetical protein